MIRKWNVIKSEKLNSYRVFSTRKDIGLSPITGKQHDFYVIEAQIWINVIAIAQNDQILLIKQYSHGIQSITFEIPGGMAGPGESPIEAAKRELLEETGCISDEWICIGKVHPNPAIQNNSCFTYLANDIKKIQKPKLDSTENTDAFFFPMEDIKGLVSEGKITHSLVAAALYWYLFVPR